MAVEITDHHIRVAIVVDVTRGQSATDVQRAEHRAGVPGGIHETTIARVAKQQFVLGVGKRAILPFDGLD